MPELCSHPQPASILGGEYEAVLRGPGEGCDWRDEMPVRCVGGTNRSGMMEHSVEFWLLVLMHLAILLPIAVLVSAVLLVLIAVVIYPLAILTLWILDRLP